MESLCYSANDVSTSLTGYEPNFMAFSEVNDLSVPFSFMIPSSDQDMDDVTLGKLLTEAHRGQADYCEPEGMSVSQSLSSVMFDGSGQLDGERNVDQSVNFGVTRFLKTSKLRKWSIDQGNLMSEIAQMHRLGLYLKNKDRRLSRNIAKKSVIMNSKQPRRRRAPTHEAHQQSLTEMEEFQSSTFDTIARRKLIEDQKHYFWNYQAEYRNCKMK